MIHGHSAVMLPQAAFWLPKHRESGGVRYSQQPLTWRFKAWKKDNMKLPNIVTAGICIQYNGGGINSFKNKLKHIMEGVLANVQESVGRTPHAQGLDKGGKNFMCRLKSLTADFKRMRNPEVELNKVGGWRDNIRIIKHEMIDTCFQSSSTDMGLHGRECFRNDQDTVENIVYASNTVFKKFQENIAKTVALDNIGMDTPFSIDLMPMVANNRIIQSLPADTMSTPRHNSTYSYANLNPAHTELRPMNDWLSAQDFMMDDNDEGVWNQARQRFVTFSLEDDMWPQDISGSQTATTVFFDGHLNYAIEYTDGQYCRTDYVCENEMA